jgi:hypothetical protein
MDGMGGMGGIGGGVGVGSDIFIIPGNFFKQVFLCLRIIKLEILYNKIKWQVEMV